MTISKDRLSTDEKHCKKCFYHFILDGHVGCEFIIVTGKRRGCEFGKTCDRYLPGNPKVRWGLPLDYDLPPGYIPGAVDQKSHKAAARRRVPLDLEAFARLRKEHTARELADLTGTSKSLWGTNIPSTQSVNPVLAKRIYDAFGIDIIKR